MAILATSGAATASAATVITATNAGEGDHVFSAGEAQVKCTTATATGTTSTLEVGSLPLHPT